MLVILLAIGHQFYANGDPPPLQEAAWIAAIVSALIGLFKLYNESRRGDP